MARIFSALLLQFGLVVGAAPRIAAAAGPSSSIPPAVETSGEPFEAGDVIEPGIIDSPDVTGLIVDAALRWGVSPERMLRVAWCESRWDPGARGPGGYQGLFQFAPSTWAWASSSVGLTGASPFDPRASAEAASWLMATKGPGQWGCR